MTQSLLLKNSVFVFTSFWYLNEVIFIISSLLILKRKIIKSHLSKQNDPKTCQKCGIFAGVNSGGTAKVTLDLIQSLPKDENVCIVYIVCDRGDRYLSSDLFI